MVGLEPWKRWDMAFGIASFPVMAALLPFFAYNFWREEKRFCFSHETAPFSYAKSAWKSVPLNFLMGRRNTVAFSLHLFKLQENRLPSFFIPSREALFYFPCLLAHHNKLAFFNSESSFRLGSRRITWGFFATGASKMEKLGQQVAGWHYWWVPYIGNKCQKTLICPNVDQMREHIFLWLSSGKTNLSSTSKYKGFLPHSCMSPFLLRLPSVWL